MNRQSRHHQLVKQASQGVFHNQNQTKYPNIHNPMNPQNNSQNPRLQQNGALIQKQQQQQRQTQVPPPTNPKTDNVNDSGSQSQISIPTAITHLSYRIMKVETTLRDQKTESSSESADVVALVSDQMDELLVRVENLENGDAISTSNKSMKTLAPPPPPIDMSVEIKKHILPYIAKMTKENKLLRGKIEEIESNLSIFQSMYSDLESRINVMYDMDAVMDENEHEQEDEIINDINDINDTNKSNELENDTVMSAITTGTPAPEENKQEEDNQEEDK